MKINPITSINIAYPTIKKNQIKESPTIIQEPVVSNSNAYHGRDMVNFRASELTPDRLAKKLFTENLLSASLAQIEQGDFLVMGKNKAEMIKLLKTFLVDFITPIKGLGICINENIDETVLLLKGNSAHSRIWNLCDKPVIVNGFSALENEDSIWIEDGDHIRLGGEWIKYKGVVEQFYQEFFSEKHFEYHSFKDSLGEMCIKHNKNIAKLLMEKFDNTKKNEKALSFDSIGGQDEVINALKRNILFPLKYPEAFEGFKLNKGAILYGPPGTGKTLIAKTLGAEANASFFEMCATEMQDMYVGQSEKNCRELFQKAIEAQPSIIFMDEIDALGKSRGSSDVHGDKLLNQFLHLVGDLNDNNDKVFIIGTTNRLEDIDPALSRSLRMGLKREVKLPDLEGTKQILKIHTKGKPIDEKLDFDKLAQKVSEKQMSGADIALIVREAGSNAFERADIYKSMDENRFAPEMLEYFRITMEDFDKALDAFSSGKKQRNPIGYTKK